MSLLLAASQRYINIGFLKKQVQVGLKVHSDAGEQLNLCSSSISRCEKKGETIALSVLFFGVFYTKLQIAPSPFSLPHHYIFCVSSLSAPLGSFFRIYILENGFSVTLLFLWQQSLLTKPFCLHTCRHTLPSLHCPAPFPAGPIQLFEERVMLFYSQTAGYC